MFKQLNILLTVLFTLTIVSQLQAAGELRRPFQGIRNLGMGNVGVAMSHDENALFYNPAGLAAVDTTLVNIPFQAEFSNDAQTLVSEASGLAGKSTSEILTSYLGKEVHLRIMFPNLSVVIPFGFMTFGVVGGTETTIDFSVSNPASIQMDFGMRLDQIYNAGLGFSLARGKWLVGFNVEQYSRCDVPIATISQAALLAGGNLGDTVGTCSAAKLRKGIAKNGDVLFAHNATVGPTAILETNEEKVILGTSLTYYRCKKNIIYPQYLLAYMNSRFFKSQYEAVMRQATRNQVPITKQREFSFIIPGYEQQVKIAKASLAAQENTKIILKLNSDKIKKCNYLKHAMIAEELKSEAV